jgi:DNA mismatch repair ATPase MutS
MLITGSNMSGKSTFLRTVGVNAILAQTVGTVCAASWRAPFVRVRTSIGRLDSLVAGKSYYMVEVDLVLALVRASDHTEQ